MLKKWLIKSGVMIIVFAGYTYVLNPARTYLSSEIIRPQFEKLSADNEHIEIVSIEPKAFLIDWKSGNEKSKSVQYKSPFGLFWGIGMVTLIAVSSPKKYYLVLNVIHVATGVFGASFLFLGACCSVHYFLISDFLIGYVEAIGSLILAPLCYIGQKNNSKGLDS